MPALLKIDWLAIEQACAAGLSFPEAATKFNVKIDTLRKRALRRKWVLPKHVEAVVRIKNEIAVQRAAENWLEKGEQHRVEAFEKASQSVKKFKARAPKSFRELEAADKIARRAAGLDTGDVVVQTLINLNERINSHNDEPIEASSVEEPEQVVEVEAEVVKTSPSEGTCATVATTSDTELTESHRQIPQDDPEASAAETTAPPLAA